MKIESSILLTKEDGLPSNAVRTFAETPDGFIWLGTNQGLTRYDGTEIKNFTHDPEDSTSICDNRILPIIADSNHLWIGTHLGFSIMDLKTEKFRNFQFDDFEVKDTFSKKILTRVHSMEKARNGDIWMGTFTSGLFRYIPSLDSFICYHYPLEKVVKHFPSPTAIDHVLGVKQDRFNDSIIWAGTGAGLLKVNAVTHKVEWFLYPKSEEKNFVSQNAIRSIYQHSDSLLYLTSWHAKVNVFNPKTTQFYLLPIENKTKTERSEGYKLLNTPTRPIVPKNEEEIWITSSRGLMTYHIKSKKWKSIQWNQRRQNKVFGIHFKDSKNRAWLPSNDGLHLFDPIQQQFVLYDYDDLNPNLEGFSYYVINPAPKHDFAILPRSGDGLFFLDVQNGSWEKFLIPKEYRTINGVFDPRGFSFSPSGEWTILSTYGVFNYHPLKKTFQLIPLPKSFQQKSLRSILWDDTGRLWIGMDNDGLLRWTPDQNKWELFKSELERTLSKTRAGKISLLFEDSHKNIWIKRANGYSVYHSQKDTFYNFVEEIDPERTGNAIRDFTEDLEGRIWLNSSLGLIAQAEAANPEKGIVKKHDLVLTQNINHLSFLQTDKQGMLWGIGGGNIYQIDPNTMAFKRNRLNYGFNDDHIYEFKILDDGRMVLGGKNKIWLADPQNFSPNAEKPIPYLTNVAVLQEPLKTDTPIHLLSNLDLSFQENFFSFDFSSIGFSKGKENKFRYRLKNFDDKWVESNERRFANFTNVPPGNYIFELQAANNEGIWNEEQYTLAVHVATPWWKTVWFWIAAIVFLLIIAYSIYRWRIVQVRKEERIKSDYERKLADVEMAALRAQMNPHFIFNSLNSIDYYIINSEPDKASDYLNRFSRLIRLILQNSKSTLVPLKDDLEALKLYIEMESLRFDDLFDYEVRLEKGMNPEHLSVPPMLLQPYVENAIWHGLMQNKNKKGKLELTLHQSNGHLLVFIEDNGVGRDAAMALKSKSATLRKSYGMKITKDRLTMLNKLAATNASVKVIDLKNRAGQAEGTRVELVIPL